MISPTGTWWSTGITVHYRDMGGDGAWGSSLTFFDDGTSDDLVTPYNISTGGTLYTRYYRDDNYARIGLESAVGVLLEDADLHRIKFQDDAFLYYKGDGEDPDFPPPPEWRALLTAEATRIGWKSYESLKENTI